MPNKIDAHSIYTYALQFARVVDLISENNLKKNTDSKDIKSKLQILATTLLPELVNSAFSTELFLKALIIHQGNSYGRDHNLNSLFYKLTEDSQNGIKELFRFSYLEAEKKEFNEDFNSLLDNNSKIFVEWRYGFEQGASVNYSFFRYFTIAVQCYAFEIFQARSITN